MGRDRMGRNEKERDWIEWEGMKRKGIGWDRMKRKGMKRKGIGRKGKVCSPVIKKKPRDITPMYPK